MTPPLLIGNFSAPLDSSAIKRINNRDEAELVQPGEIIQRWDYIVEIDEIDVFLPSEIEHLRRRGDTLADAVVDHLDLKPGQDGLASLVSAMSSTEIHPSVLAFWSDVNREPPEGVTAFTQPLSADKKIRPLEECTPIAAIRECDRFAEPSLAQGQAVFWRYSAQVFTALLHFSLAGGFSSPKLASVMEETAYLTSGNREATYRRLLETTLFVLDVMSDMAVGEGRGWKSSIRVRLLHAQVRRKIRMGKGRVNKHDNELSGIPINQQDLLAVLGSFMIAPIWSMKRTGIHLSAQELSSYQSCWRHVGFYLGIEPELLITFYGSTYSTAEKSFAYLAFDLFPTFIPKDGTKTSTYDILSAVSARPPRDSTVGYHLEYARTLQGDSLADQLALPRGTKRERIAVQIDGWSSWTLITFGRNYRKDWEVERQMLFKEIMELLVVWQLGARRTLYVWREVQLHSLKFSESEGEEPGIEMGAHVGKRVKLRWIKLIGEMVGVIAGVATLGIGLGWQFRGTLGMGL